MAGKRNLRPLELLELEQTNIRGKLNVAKMPTLTRRKGLADKQNAWAKRRQSGGARRAKYCDRARARNNLSQARDAVMKPTDKSTPAPDKASPANVPHDVDPMMTTACLISVCRRNDSGAALLSTQARRQLRSSTNSAMTTPTPR